MIRQGRYPFSQMSSGRVRRSAAFQGPRWRPRRHWRSRPGQKNICLLKNMHSLWRGKHVSPFANSNQPVFLTRVPAHYHPSLRSANIFDGTTPPFCIFRNPSALFFLDILNQIKINARFINGRWNSNRRLSLHPQVPPSFLSV